MEVEDLHLVTHQRVGVLTPLGESTWGEFFILCRSSGVFLADEMRILQPPQVLKIWERLIHLNSQACIARYRGSADLGECLVRAIRTTVLAACLRRITRSLDQAHSANSGRIETVTG